MELKGRFRGCLLGLAIGDAIGVTSEFRDRGTFKPVTDMIGGGKFNLAPGQWSDDTSMALCLAESLIACDGFDAKDQMDRYVEWCEKGTNSSTAKCFGIGKIIVKALGRYKTHERVSGRSYPPQNSWQWLIDEAGPNPNFFLPRSK